MAGGIDLTASQRDLMLIHMVRCSKVLELVAEKIQPDDFDGPIEMGFRAIWEIAQKHWKDYKSISG